MRKLWLMLALVAAVTVGCSLGYVKRTEEFATQVKSVVNPDELQAWATNLIATTPIAAREKWVDVKETDVPSYVRTIYREYPPDVYISNCGDNPYVLICQGSGIGHWGLYVGNPDWRQESSEQFYVVPWKPEIYFWNSP